MQVKPKDIEIDQDNPFANDLLHRKEEIENLSPLLLNMAGPFVFSIDSPWGTGKTTFIKLWRSWLQSQEVSSIYFNAWESDYTEDPLVALVSELDKWVLSRGSETAADGAWKKAKSLLPGIAKSTAVAAAKAATFGGLDIEKEYEKVAADIAGGVANDLVDSFNIQSEAIRVFKGKIEETLSELGGSQNNIIIFIDELDRCRPSYAIQLLERIKHLFNIDRLVFVLSTDFDQLSHSICAIYGNNFDARKYLQRFIDLDYSLKEPESKIYIKSLFHSLSVNDYFSQRREGNYELKNLTDLCVVLTDRFKLSLRDINQLIMRIRLILSSVPPAHYLDSAMIVSLLLLRKYNKNLYSKYSVDPSVADEVIEFLSTGLPSESKNSVPFCLIIGYLISPNMGLQGDRFNELLSPYEEIISNEEDTTDLYRTAYKIIQTAKNTRDFGRTMSHKNSIDRIELLHRINIGLKHEG